MIISRKKYEEALAKAAEEAESKIYERQYHDESLRRAHERIDELEKRLYMHENPDKQVEGFCRNCPRPALEPVLPR